MDFEQLGEQVGERVVSVFIGTKYEREVKKLRPRIERINAL